MAREGLPAAGLNCAFEVPMLIAHNSKRSSDLLTCLEAPSPSNPVPHNTAMDVTIRSSRVAPLRRHAAEKPRGTAPFAEREKRNDLAKAFASSAAAAGTAVPTLSVQVPPLSFDQYGAPGESTLEFLEKLSIRMAMRAYCSPGAVLRRLILVISFRIRSVRTPAVLALQPSTFAYLSVRPARFSQTQSLNADVNRQVQPGQLYSSDRCQTTRVGILMTSDFRLIETACIHCLYKPVFGTELGESSLAAFNSQTTLLKLVFTDCWDLANPNRGMSVVERSSLSLTRSDQQAGRSLTSHYGQPRVARTAFWSRPGARPRGRRSAGLG
jgi:hypothetical protein